MTLNDYDNHFIGIKIEFEIESYAFCVYLAVFEIYDPKMTFFYPSDDLGWSWDVHHWIQNKIFGRAICLSRALGYFSDFWPQMTFSNLRMIFLTPKMTSNDLDMHIIRIWIKLRIDSYAYHVHLAIFSIFDSKMTFFDPLNDLGLPRDAHHWI